MKVTVNALLAIIAVIIVCLFGVSFIFYTKNRNLSNEVSELKQKQELLANMLFTRNVVSQSQNRAQQQSEPVCTEEKCSVSPVAEPVVVDNEANRTLSKNEFIDAANTIQEVDISNLIGRDLPTIPEEDVAYDITREIENSIDEDIIQEEVTEMIDQQNKEDNTPFDLVEEVRDLNMEDDYVIEDDEDSENEESDDEESEDDEDDEDSEMNTSVLSSIPEDKELIEGDELIEVEVEVSDNEEEQESAEVDIEEVLSLPEESSVEEIEISISDDEEKPEEVEEAQCEYVYKRGKSKGKRCENPAFVDGCCKSHAGKN